MGKALRGMLRTSPFDGLTALLGLIVAIAGVYPVCQVLVRLFWNGHDLDFGPLRAVITMPGLFEVLTDTAIVVTASAMAALVLGGVLAWLNERTDARIGLLTDALPISNMLLPAIAGSIAWVLLLSPRAGFLNFLIRQVLGLVGIELEEGPFDINSWFGLILVYTLQMVPFAFIAISSGFRQLDGAMEEQARVCGASSVKVMFTVTLPSILPNVVAAVFLLAWIGLSTVSVPIIIAPAAGIEILSVRIVRALNFTYPPLPELAIGLSGFVLLTLAAIWLFQRRLLRTQRFGTISGKGLRVETVAMGRWRLPAQMLIVLYGVFSTILPIAALVLVSLHGFWTTDIEWSRLSVGLFYQTLVRDHVTVRALGNSVVLAVAGATACTLIAALVSLWVFRSQSAFAKSVDAAIKFPGTMSSVVVAVGIILAFAGPPLSLAGTVWILLIAYISISLPEGSVLADAAVGAIGRELSEASHVSGAGLARTFWFVHLPLLAPGLLAAWALLFVRIVGDINASSILASTGNTVVGFRILEIYTNGSLARLAVLATALTGISCIALLACLGLSHFWSRWTRSSGSSLRLAPT